MEGGWRVDGGWMDGGVDGGWMEDRREEIGRLEGRGRGYDILM